MQYPLAVGVIVSLSLFTVSPVVDIQEPTMSRCTITISSPKPGTQVGASGTVKGTAQIPASSYLWVLAHKKTLNAWWPQGGGETPISSRQWGDIEVTYGEARD